jgi:hypothetical protein
MSNIQESIGEQSFNFNDEIDKVTEINISDAFLPLFTDIGKTRIMSIYGGRAAGKSIHITRAIIYRIKQFLKGELSSRLVINPKERTITQNGVKIRNPELNLPYSSSDIFNPSRHIDTFNILVLREIADSSIDSAKGVITEWLEKEGIIELFHITNDEIRTKDFDKSHSLYPYRVKIKFSGLSATTQDKTKSIEETDICFIEEANTISDKAFNTLEPGIRRARYYVDENYVEYDSNEILATVILAFNPSHENTDTYIKYVLNADPKRVKKIYVTYLDNRYLPSFLENDIEETRLRNIEEYNNTWLGIPKKKGEYNLWTRENLSNSIINTEFTFKELLLDLRQQGATFYLSVDPAVTVKKESCFSGIIYGCLLNNKIYILKDFTKAHADISQIMQELYNEFTVNKYYLDEIIWETNQGGTSLMNLSLRHFGIAARPVYQREKKEQRINLAYTDYTQKRVFHYHVSDDPDNRNLSVLEDDMIKYAIDEKERKLYNLKIDRVDALSTLATEILINKRHLGINNSFGSNIQGNEEIKKLTSDIWVENKKDYDSFESYDDIIDNYGNNFSF